MTPRALRFASALVLALAAPASCSRANSRAPAPLVVRTDLGRLAQLVPLPAGASEARWVVRARGVPSIAPGPTDTELVAFVVYPEARWAQLETDLGGARGIEALQLDDSIARAVLPTAVYATSAAQGDRRRLRGDHYELPTGPSAGNYRGTGALRIGAALVVVRYAE